MSSGKQRKAKPFSVPIKKELQKSMKMVMKVLSRYPTK